MAKALSPAAESQLNEMWDDYQRRRRKGNRPPGSLIPPGMYVAKTVGTITAASGATVGTGTATLQKLAAGALSNATDSLGSTITVTVKNFVPTASASNAYVFIIKASGDDDDDVFWLVAEACA